MKDLTQIAMDTAIEQGATYADIRIIETRSEQLVVRNGQVNTLDANSSLGYGIRVLFNGAWGFASSVELSPKHIRDTTLLAVRIARASSQIIGDPMVLVPEPVCEDFWATPFMIHPAHVSLESKLSLLSSAEAILRQDSRIKMSKAQMEYLSEKQYFANSYGSYLIQELLRSGCGISATAVQNGESQTRSYPMSFGGNYRGGGYEVILSAQLLENAERVREEALQLLQAEPCPTQLTDIVLGPSQMVLQIHESVGHANELDRVLGWEANFAGRSFNTIDHLGSFVYGSPCVNLVADNTLPQGLSTQGYDDDGVPAQRFYVVQHGVFKNYFTTRDTARFIQKERSNGCNRAQGFAHIPITRIPNLSLMPGEMTREELIQGVNDGIYMDTNRCWSIDQMRLNFQFGCEIAYEIKKGKIGKLYKNPTYQGLTPQFWRSCDGVANQESWEVIGIINCGKGQPMQIAEMSHGSSPARFRNVQVGVKV